MHALVAGLVRRVSAFLGLMLVWHLNLVAGDFVCSTDHEQSAEATPEASSHSGHQQRAASDDSSDAAESCETPIRPKCCEALTSCTITVVFNHSDVQRPLTGAASKISPDSTRPLSLISSPDTPPPNA